MPADEQSLSDYIIVGAGVLIWLNTPGFGFNHFPRHTKAMRITVAEYIKALSYSAEIKGFELDNL